jgi:hypothetical protein
MRKSNLILCSSLKKHLEKYQSTVYGILVLDIVLAKCWMAARSLEHSLSSMQFGQKTATAYIASFFLFPGNHRPFSQL